MVDSSSGSDDGGVDVGGLTPINIRNLSIRCGHCGEYQTLVGFSGGAEWNVYRYECENGVCEPERSRTLVEVPSSLDEYAQRDPTWRGGRRHAGAEAEPSGD
ncbi:MAG: hypothetical protein DWQ36_01340 [Acidobacteria bacterium]|nr:MAG: hypothetical protein DWQ30_14130 [Acidobacteriota bacterium]REK11656.1 MAG: hypothetical protein DWQ36_01340 [Acidobacteriota bacterium]